ncbi:MAG: helix-turn-helix domain-containing protein [Thermoplasmata archaeon]|nr:helix-turn-helix domain-containing protein [Thermoplasmata archaeon]
MDLEEKIAGEIVLSSKPGATMRKWREIFRISQQEIARHLGISASVISDYESGRRKSPGVGMVRKFVRALMEIDESKGGDTIKKFSPTYGEEAIIDMRDFPYKVSLEEFMSAAQAEIINKEIEPKRPIYGYTILDSIKAILHYNSFDYLKVYGWSIDRVLIFTGVYYGRSPMIAIRAHPLKPSAVVYVQPHKVDELAIKLATIENIPLAVTKLDVKKLKENLREL